MEQVSKFCSLHATALSFFDWLMTDLTTSILNICTYHSSDGQLVSQGSVLRSWSIHPWPSPNLDLDFDLDLNLGHDLDLSTLDQSPTLNSTRISPQNFSHDNVPSFPLQWQCPSYPNHLCLWFHLPNIWADKLGNVKTGRFFRKIYLGQVMNIRTKEAKVKSSPR